jgi:leucyl/phenylalanyl-tRNA--protein transferase
MLFSHTLVPEIVLMAYRQGYFPMSEGKEGQLYWHKPQYRAIIPLADIKKPPRSLRQSIRKYGYTFTVDHSFRDVITACADREETWISEEIIDTYTQLNQMGHAHSIETWHEGELVGGLYGLAIGGAFFGESMFSKMTDASKAAYYHLVKILRQNNFILLDSQYINRFTAQLGAIEVSDHVYMELLKRSLEIDCEFANLPE